MSERPTIWIVTWFHEDGEYGAWAAASLGAAIRSIAENEGALEDPDNWRTDEEEIDLVPLSDVTWQMDGRGTMVVTGEASGMRYDAEQQAVAV